jgi:cyclophilin family peptidyl-prolyl cis-trans isomerase
MWKWLNIILGIGVLALVMSIIIKPQAPAQTAPVLTGSPTPTQEGNPSMSPTSSTSTSNKQYMAAKQVIKAGKSYTATLHTTAGDIVISLSKDTPVTTNNFVFLAEDHFYDGVIFHRVIPGFMIQGGDPTGTGMGGPGYQFNDEPFTGKYTRGTVAMANAGKDTNGSQFFIMHADYALPPNYVIFGQTISGLDVVDKIAAGKTGASDRPVNPVVIKSVDVVEK